ncbi:MAG: LytR C-terminal domain-containing protein [Bacteroidetes bacterium]|nr:LytR C-terminal domain-containing protein [Bacteroidota bacterium]MDE2671747.1 LytR C-terminal domain-containing protein [Bacteroidota bacterium]MXZ05233.1 LytR family transcriptional regulator [Rhodothermaceae bacterium]MYF40817.1 LytR family transcriptional regulator [Rhodothermaceae bacterium]
MSRLKAFCIDIIAALVGLVIVVGIVSTFTNVPFLRDAVLFPVQVASSGEISDYPGTTDMYQVEVRNGVGVNGVAERMRGYLRSKGYDVVGVGNHRSFDVEKTIIVDRIDNLAIAQQVAASLGLPQDRISKDVRDEFHLDVSIIIGKDYGMIPPFSETTNSSDIPDLHDSN